MATIRQTGIVRCTHQRISIFDMVTQLIPRTDISWAMICRGHYVLPHQACRYRVSVSAVWALTGCCSCLHFQVNIKPKVPTKAVCAEHLELRKEILMLLNLQKQNKEAEASASRDSPYGDVATPSTPKRSHRGGDQPFQQDSIGFTGERVGKREHKRKILGRYSDGPPSPPQSKRARKMKASDG
ncbi:SWR1-complex protein 4 [Nymphaea thermarum]|nr:SWR1-complex protein 4 [Nymphaea thermarum]